MQILNIFHVLIAIALVGFVLIQKGQGATAGAAFGSGASGTVFGARGAGNFLSRTTWVLAALFCTLSLTIAVLVSRAVDLPDANLGVVESATTVPRQVEEAPAAAIPDSGTGGEVQSDLPAIDSSAVDAMISEGEEAANSLNDDIPEVPGFEETTPPTDVPTSGGTDTD